MSRELTSSSDKFNAWLEKAKPGDEYCYHRSTPKNGIFGRPVALFGELYELASVGRIALLQRKLKPFHFDYIAVKLSDRSPDWLWPLPADKGTAPMRSSFLNPRNRRD